MGAGGGSVFLDVPAAEHVAANDLAFAIRDRFPVSAGHTLVVPRRVVATWWEATRDEQHAIVELIDVVKRRLDEELAPAGYNVGFNAGPAAGQTVAHLHVHVIPRYAGDHPDPRGGVRAVIPAKANYLAAAPEPFVLDGTDRRLLLELLRCLRERAFDRIDLLVSFVMSSGLAMILEPLRDALVAGARLRVLTSDYLAITDAGALRVLLELHHEHGAAATTRVFSDPSLSFHPKSYMFWSSREPIGRAYVGSSNLSRSGIDGGVEWNVGVERVAPLVAEFERLWDDPRSRPLDELWLRQYAQRYVQRPRPQPGQSAPSPDLAEAEPLPAPTTVQREALTALEQTRQVGFGAGLVVMATGLGKTWLAAFDSQRPEFRRTLFVAHRDELLRQARRVFQRLRPDARTGMFTGDEREPDADLVFASVQSLARHLHRFAPDRFDYVVVDEFHHAAAASYRKVIAHFTPKFLLGITATPDRADRADLLALCSDNIVYRCDLVEGVRRELLAPFRYLGVKDDADYAHIPWRNGRFDPDALDAAVATQARADQALELWRQHGQTRCLAFCASVRHADFMARHFAAAGVRAVAVHTTEGSADRHEAIAQLAAGQLDVVFSVDLFNEGLDVPLVDTVLMLRPTESPVLFLQQLGRGLRRAPGKAFVQVVDLIGNHRSFLQKPLVLAALAGHDVMTARQAVDALKGEVELPPGCEILLEPEVVDLLRELAGRTTSGVELLKQFCVDFAATHGRRPTAAEAYAAGANPAMAPDKDWFGLLEELGLLDEAEQAVRRTHGEFLRDLQIETMTKSYKVFTLRALFTDEGVTHGRPVKEILEAARRAMLADPRVANEPAGVRMPSPATASLAEWERLWREMPIAKLTTPTARKPKRLFVVDADDRLRLVAPVADFEREAFLAMANETLDYLLARYLDRTSDGCRVIHAGGKPIVKLNRKAMDLPTGEVPLVADGVTYTARFAKEYLNTVWLPGDATRTNRMPEILRSWFGPDAGAPGTTFAVAFERRSDHWVMQRAEQRTGLQKSG